MSLISRMPVPAMRFRPLVRELVRSASVGFAIFGILACASTGDDTATRKIGDPRGSNHDAAVGGGGNQASSGGSAGRRGNGGSPGMGGSSGASDGAVSGSGGSVTGGAAGDSGVGSDAGGAKADASPPPTEVPSAQTVTFHITNASNADRYIVVRGNNCTSAEIDRLSDGGQTLIPTELGYQCPCECPMPGAALPTAFQRLRPGESVTMTWDARGLTTWRQGTLCYDGPSPSPRPSSSVTGVLRPVEAGTYRITLGVELSLPAGCNGSGTGPEYPCDISYASNDMSELAPRCTTSSIATVDFSLPTFGDVQATVELK